MCINNILSDTNCKSSNVLPSSIWTRSCGQGVIARENVASRNNPPPALCTKAKVAKRGGRGGGGLFAGHYGSCYTIHHTSPGLLQTSNGTLVIPECSVLGLASAKCAFHPISAMSYCPSHPTVSHLVWPVLSIPIPLYHGKEWADWDHTICYTAVPTVHPIPLYRGRE